MKDKSLPARGSVATRLLSTFVAACLLIASVTVPASAEAEPTGDADTIGLSPNSWGSGTLPSGYAHVDFSLWDGDWTPNLVLPAAPRGGDTVTIRSEAGYSSWIDVRTTDLPTEYLELRRGQRYFFAFDRAKGRWRVEGDSILRSSPSRDGGAIAAGDQQFILYEIEEDDWAGRISLPSSGRDFARLVVYSQSSQPAVIDPGSVAYASTMTVLQGDRYLFRYRAELGAWELESYPERPARAADDLAAMTSPASVVTVTSADAGLPIVLPARVDDRNRIIVKSTAGEAAHVSPEHIEARGPLTVLSGDLYSFLYIAERGIWVVLSSPDRIISSEEVADGSLADFTAPRTILTVREGEAVASVTLPTRVPDGARFVIEHPADGSTIVQSGTEQHEIRTGEVVAFAAGSDGLWKRETHTIDLLLLYSAKAAARNGEERERQRLREGLTLTNEALENSGTNVRFRAVGLKMLHTPDSWRALGDALSGLRDEPTAQGWREEVAAHGIYYEGTEDGCGLAFARASRYNMVATGSTGCGTTVMRHELGHNLGLAHAGESGWYNQGSALVSSVMGGNSIPFYSTPLRYTKEGLPLGIPDTVDAVRAINEFGPTIANWWPAG